MVGTARVRGTPGVEEESCRHRAEIVRMCGRVPPYGPGGGRRRARGESAAAAASTSARAVVRGERGARARTRVISNDSGVWSGYDGQGGASERTPGAGEKAITAGQSE